MINKVLTAIKQFSLIQKGDTVTVALSGGADSIALLHVLWSLKDELSINLKAAHLNHGIRGNEADRDQAFVEWFCDKYDIPITVKTVNVPEIAQQNHQSIELAAREVRYEFLKQNAEGVVATAHTASDNAETVLLNLTRGTGIKGLCGIPVKRENFIRPLILCSREDVEVYCAENSLSFVNDSTNQSDDYTRNKIRHNVVTVLKYINPSFEDAITRTTDTLKEDNAALDLLASELLYKSLTEEGILVDNINNAPSAIVKRVIIKFAESVTENTVLDYFHVNALYEICKTGGKISLPNGFYGQVKNGVLTIFNNDANECEEYFVKLLKTDKVNNLLSNNLLDCDKIIGNPVIRTRIEGDTIRLKNRGCTKTLNKLFTENKIDPALRDNIPVIADDKGVIWVYGIGVSQRCAATKNTKNFVEVQTGLIK